MGREPILPTERGSVLQRVPLIDRTQLQREKCGVERLPEMAPPIGLPRGVERPHLLLHRPVLLPPSQPLLLSCPTSPPTPPACLLGGRRLRGLIPARCGGSG